jgi:hypothetical protein
MGTIWSRRQEEPPNGLELSCPAEAGRQPVILAHNGGPGTATYGPARRVSFSELLGSRVLAKETDGTSRPLDWVRVAGRVWRIATLPHR